MCIKRKKEIIKEWINNKKKCLIIYNNFCEIIDSIEASLFNNLHLKNEVFINDSHIIKKNKIFNKYKIFVKKNIEKISIFKFKKTQSLNYKKTNNFISWLNFIKFTILYSRCICFMIYYSNNYENIKNLTDDIILSLTVLDIVNEIN